MIIAGTHPPEYAAARAARARRAAQARSGERDEEEVVEMEPRAGDQPGTSAVDIAPRPPAD